MLHQSLEDTDSSAFGETLQPAERGMNRLLEAVNLTSALQGV